MKSAIRAAAKPRIAATVSHENVKAISINLDTANHAVSLPHGCGLDLGGIGKGLAADRVVEGLIARGAVSACVSMGGDLRVAGPGPDRDDAWEIRVEDPRGTLVATGTLVYRIVI